LPEGSDVSFLETASLGTQAVNALVFAAAIPAADGQSEVAVIVFDHGAAHLGFYRWIEGGVGVEVRGAPPAQRVHVSAGFYGPLDSHASPARDFNAVVAAAEDGVRVVSDDRPWLGVAGYPDDPDAPHRFTVTSVLSDSPAFGRLRPGDIITGVDGGADAGSPSGAPDNRSDVLCLLEQSLAGATVDLAVTREGNHLTVPVTFGSLIDAGAVEAGASSWYLLEEGPAR
jgi:hypothetical protein